MHFLYTVQQPAPICGHNVCRSRARSTSQNRDLLDLPESAVKFQLFLRGVIEAAEVDVVHARTQARFHHVKIVIILNAVYADVCSFEEFGGLFDVCHVRLRGLDTPALERGRELLGLLQIAAGDDYLIVRCVEDVTYAYGAHSSVAAEDDELSHRCLSPSRSRTTSTRSERARGQRRSASRLRKAFVDQTSRCCSRRHSPLR